MQSLSLLLFFLDDNRYAIELSSVERAYPAVETCQSAGKTVVTIQGEQIPVLDVRAYFKLSAREVAVSDTMLVILDEKDSARSAIIVDSVGDILEYNAEQMVIADSLLHGRVQINVIAVSAGKFVAAEMRDYLTRAGRNLLNLPDA